MVWIFFRAMKHIGRSRSRSISSRPSCQCHQGVDRHHPWSRMTPGEQGREQEAEVLQLEGEVGGSLQGRTWGRAGGGGVVEAVPELTAISRGGQSGLATGNSLSLLSRESRPWWRVERRLSRRWQNAREWSWPSLPPPPSLCNGRSRSSRSRNKSSRSRTWAPN